MQNEDDLDMASNLKYKGLYWNKGRIVTAWERESCEQRKEYYDQWKGVFP
jgi:hypothetical protein